MPPKKTMVLWMCVGIAAFVGLTPAPAGTAEAAPNNLVVYGATPGGIMAAVAAARAGDHVLLLEPGYLVGGMMSGGLTKTDIGNRSTVGGLSLEFYQRVHAYYAKTYGADSPQVKQSHEGVFFEPHVADLVFSDLLREAGVEVRRKQRLVSTEVALNRVTGISVVNTATQVETIVGGDEFIDATYEGDLLAAAHVPYRIGREARAEYGERLAGMTAGPEAYLGSGDHRLQSFNIRSTLTTRDDIRVSIPKPRYYTPQPAHNFVNAVKKRKIHTFEELFTDWIHWGEINGKFDPNKADYVGANYNYPEADPAARAEIVDHVRDYWLSLWWTLQNDPELPDDFKTSARRWGLPTDEFVESGHVTPQLYVREARRMLGRYLLTERDLEFDRHKPDAICMGSYNIDSHEVQTVRLSTGLVVDGSLLGMSTSVKPWEIPYRAITPGAPSNLLVVCAVSATHIAYASLRMEPVFMMIGQAAGLASHLARSGNTSVQEILVSALQAKLTAAGVPLRAPYFPSVALTVPSHQVDIGEAVKFKARVFEGNEPLSYVWNFGGSEMKATEPVTRFAFPVRTNCVVSLKIVDGNGVSSLVVMEPIVVGGDLPRD